MVANRTTRRNGASAAWLAPLALAGIACATPAGAQTHAGPAAPPANDPARQVERQAPQERRSGAFIETMPNDVFRASKLVGIGVIGEETRAIGKVDDLLVDRSGRGVAVVIATGGFLGLGEKHVAVPFDAVLWNTADGALRAPTRDVLTAGTRPDQPDSQKAAESMPGAKVGDESLNAQNVGRSGVADPATGPAGAARGDQPPATEVVVGRGGEASRAQVRLTRGDLENAPAFHYTKEGGRQR
ncbi:MAG TPA: PRC-barrel domain-containing protein [Enterovirga sp.]